MTLVTTSPRSPTYAGNGITTQFPTVFQFDDNAHVVPVVIDPDGNENDLTSGFSVTGSRTSAGGVTLTSPLPAGYSIYLARRTPSGQPVAVRNLGRFAPDVHEQAWDRLAMQIQEAGDASLDRGAVVDLIEQAGVQVDGLLRGDLADGSTGKGASMLAFKQAGLTATTRSVNRKLQSLLELTDYVPEANIAAALNGTFDVSDAFVSACTEAMARGRWGVQLPAGRLLFAKTSVVTIAGQVGLSVEGAGMGLTQIIAPAGGNAMSVTFGAGSGNWWLNASPSNAVRIANLSVLTAGLNVGTGIMLDGGSLEGRPSAPIVIENVEIRAVGSINDQAFAVGLHLHDCSSVWVRGCRFLVGGNVNQVPTAVKITSTDGTTDPTSIFFDHCEWWYGGVGIEVGDYVEGVYFTNCSGVALGTMVKWETTTGESGFHWIGGHVNTTGDCFVLGGLYDWTIANALIFGPGSPNHDVIRLTNGGRAVITGNTIHGRGQAGSAGVRIAASSSNVEHAISIQGNNFTSIDRGVVLGGGANRVYVGENNYSGITTQRVVDVGPTNVVAPRVYSATVVRTMVGGAAFESVDIAIPTGVFFAAPQAGMALQESSSGQDLQGYFMQTDPATTQINARFRVVRRDGASIAAGDVRFSVILTGL